MACSTRQSSITGRPVSRTSNICDLVCDRVAPVSAAQLTDPRDRYAPDTLAEPHRYVSLRIATSLVPRRIADPLPKQLVTHRKHHGADEQANDAVGHHAAQRTDEHHRHRHIDTASQ